MTCTLIPAGQETIEQYHASGAWGSTLISHLRRSPRLAHLIRTGTWRPTPTASMRFGTAFHALMDPGGQFDRRYRLGPDVDHRTKAWKEAVAAAEADSTTLLSPDDQTDLQAMRASVLANPVAAHLLYEAEHEVGFRGTTPYGTFQVQCRADALVTGSHLADVKTTGDVDEFAQSVLTYGYHRQAALYRWIVHAATGRWLPFIFIVVETAAPLYRCRVVELSDAYLQHGWQEVEVALMEIGRRTTANDWSDHREAETVDLPLRLQRSLEVAA